MSEPHEVNDTITLMVLQGPTGNIRRIHLRRSWLRKAASGAAVARLRHDRDCRSTTCARASSSASSTICGPRRGEQREQIDVYSDQIGEIAQKLAKIDQLERKLRVITNMDPADPLPLPGDRRQRRGGAGSRRRLALARAAPQGNGRGAGHALVRQRGQGRVARDAAGASRGELRAPAPDPVDRADARLDDLDVRLPHLAVHREARVPPRDRHRRPLRYARWSPRPTEWSSLAGKRRAFGKP